MCVCVHACVHTCMCLHNLHIIYFTELVPSLLAGLSDPNNRATACLKSLLETEFVHVVDAPSLALIMPILERALQLRSTESKKMATQIIANMYSLTEPKELEPYMSAVLPRLKQALVDPVPEVEWDHFITY